MLQRRNGTEKNTIIIIIIIVIIMQVTYFCEKDDCQKHYYLKVFLFMFHYSFLFVK